MKALLRSLRTFVADDYHPRVYGFTALFLGGAIFIDHYFGLHRILADYFATPLGTVYHFAVYAPVYYAVAVAQVVRRRQLETLWRPVFWLKSGLLLCLISVSSSGVFYAGLEKLALDRHTLHYVALVVFELQTTVLYLLPLLCMWLYFERNVESFYGLTLRGGRLWPYMLIVVALLPMVVLASYNVEFRITYPMFKPWSAQPVLGLSVRQMAVIYELAYGWQFVMLELMFRGALVIGMAALLGRGAVLPMVAVYVCSHFGKPLPETIGSAFAGYLLGVAAYETRSIAGCVLVHVGVAYGMDAAAYWQRL